MHVVKNPNQIDGPGEGIEFKFLHAVSSMTNKEGDRAGIGAKKLEISTAAGTRKRPKMARGVF